MDESIQGIDYERAKKSSQPKFVVGQMIHHKLFDYHGVIIGVDGEFKSTDEWYEKVATSRPPKDKPWYHVQVHGGGGIRYVAEQNLECDPSVWN